MRRLLTLLCVLGSGILSAQITGQLTLSKTVFARGEPVFLNLEIRNTSGNVVRIETANPYTFCAGYQIWITGDPSPTSSCARGYAGSCLSSDLNLEPGDTFRERILLNYGHALREPGVYDVKAAKLGMYFENRKGPVNNGTRYDIEFHGSFSIDKDAESDPNALRALVDQLRSDDLMKRGEAARILATLAPASLEETLMQFPEIPEFRSYAPDALFGLRTTASLSALAALLVKSEPGTYESLKSSELLAKTGDSKWYPLLAAMARKNPSIPYVEDAAKLGGADALPLLTELLDSSDKEFARPNAMASLGETGARAAIPILIEGLKDPAEDTAAGAVNALRSLTHLSFAGDHWQFTPRQQYEDWRSWWKSQGQSARIYKSDECGEIVHMK